MRGSKVPFSRLSQLPHGQASTGYGALKIGPSLAILLATGDWQVSPAGVPQRTTARLPGRLTIVGQPGLFLRRLASMPYLTFGVICSFALSILRRPVV